MKQALLLSPFYTEGNQDLITVPRSQGQEVKKLEPLGPTCHILNRYTELPSPTWSIRPHRNGDHHCLSKT